jgi:hypothetical protein
MNTKNSLVIHIQEEIEKLRKDFVFLWIPSHVGIVGNELADELAKRGRERGKTGNELVGREDLKNKTKLKTWEKWMRELIRARNRVYGLRGTVRREDRSNLSRRDARIISRLRIGHTRVTHAHLMTRDPPPICVCGEDFTVDHILNCPNANNIRNDMNVTGAELLRGLDDTNARKTIDYIKAIGLYYEI